MSAQGLQQPAAGVEQYGAHEPMKALNCLARHAIMTSKHVGEEAQSGGTVPDKYCIETSTVVIQPRLDEMRKVLEANGIHFQPSHLIELDFIAFQAEINVNATFAASIFGADEEQKSKEMYGHWAREIKYTSISEPCRVSLLAQFEEAFSSEVVRTASLVHQVFFYRRFNYLSHYGFAVIPGSAHKNTEDVWPDDVFRIVRVPFVHNMEKGPTNLIAHQNLASPVGVPAAFNSHRRVGAQYHTPPSADLIQQGTETSVSVTPESSPHPCPAARHRSTVEEDIDNLIAEVSNEWDPYPGSELPEWINEVLEDPEKVHKYDPPSLEETRDPDYDAFCEKAWADCKELDSQAGSNTAQLIEEGRCLVGKQQADSGVSVEIKENAPTLGQSQSENQPAAAWSALELSTLVEELSYVKDLTFISTVDGVEPVVDEETALVDEPAVAAETALVEGPVGSHGSTEFEGRTVSKQSDNKESAEMAITTESMDAQDFLSLDNSSDPDPLMKILNPAGIIGNMPPLHAEGVATQSPAMDETPVTEQSAVAEQTSIADHTSGREVVETSNAIGADEFSWDPVSDVDMPGLPTSVVTEQPAVAEQTSIADHTPGREVVETSDAIGADDFAWHLESDEEEQSVEQQGTKSGGSKSRRRDPGTYENPDSLPHVPVIDAKAFAIAKVLDQREMERLQAEAKKKEEEEKRMREEAAAQGQQEQPEQRERPSSSHLGPDRNLMDDSWHEKVAEIHQENIKDGGAAMAASLNAARQARSSQRKRKATTKTAIHTPSPNGGDDNGVIVISDNKAAEAARPVPKRQRVKSTTHGHGTVTPKNKKYEASAHSNLGLHTDPPEFFSKNKVNKKQSSRSPVVSGSARRQPAQRALAPAPARASAPSVPVQVLARPQQQISNAAVRQNVAAPRDVMAPQHAFGASQGQGPQPDALPQLAVRRQSEFSSQNIAARQNTTRSPRASGMQHVPGPQNMNGAQNAPGAQNGHPPQHVVDPQRMTATQQVSGHQPMTGVQNTGSSQIFPGVQAQNHQQQMFTPAPPMMVQQFVRTEYKQQQPQQMLAPTPSAAQQFMPSQQEIPAQQQQGFDPMLFPVNNTEQFMPSQQEMPAQQQQGFNPMLFPVNDMQQFMPDQQMMPAQQQQGLNSTLYPMNDMQQFMPNQQEMATQQQQGFDPMLFPVNDMQQQFMPNQQFTPAQQAMPEQQLQQVNSMLCQMNAMQQQVNMMMQQWSTMQKGGNGGNGSN